MSSFDVNSVCVNLSYKKSISQITEIYDNPHTSSKPLQLLCAFRILRQNAHHLPLAGIKRDNWNSTPQSFKRMQKILSIIANVNVLQEHDREKQLTYDEAGQLHAR